MQPQRTQVHTHIVKKMKKQQLCDLVDLAVHQAAFLQPCCSTVVGGEGSAENLGQSTAVPATLISSYVRSVQHKAHGSNYCNNMTHMRDLSA
jgi:hypothetical protein